MDLVILDLRFNGGGSLTEAVDLTGLFVDHGPIVQVKDSYGRVQVYDDQDSGMAWKGPLVVVTSKFSASASEIFAGAIQDYGRGLVVGDEATHGKGTVQNLLDVGGAVVPHSQSAQLGALKLTTQQFYRPNGESTQKRGVLPDLVLPSLLNLMGTGEADLDYAIEFDRVRAARFQPNQHGAATMSWRACGLAHRSGSPGRKISPSCRKTSSAIHATRRKKRFRSTKLKFEARRAAERDAEKEEEKHVDAQNGKDNEVYKDDYYNREVVQIGMDYLSELNQRNLARR